MMRRYFKRYNIVLCEKFATVQCYTCNRSHQKSNTFGLQSAEVVRAVVSFAFIHLQNNNEELARKARGSNLLNCRVDTPFRSLAVFPRRHIGAQRGEQSWPTPQSIALCTLSAALSLLSAAGLSSEASGQRRGSLTRCGYGLSTTDTI